MTWKVSNDQLERWKIGNEDEKSFWLGLREQDFRDQESGYRALAQQIMDRLATYGIRTNGRCLQIGCAIEDTVFFMKGDERQAIDPLADFYKRHFSRANNPAVDNRQGVGESSPFQDSFFDVAILQNLLDHVANHHVVLEEIRRVFRPSNLAFFGTDVYEEQEAASRWQREAMGEVFDIQHPNTFTESSLEATLEEHGFEILERNPRQPSGKGDSSYRHCLYAKSA